VRDEAADDALLAAMVAGDTDAAAAFLRRFQHRVFGVALAVVGDRGRADDVAQEAFLRAWRHGSSYDARRGSVATWLLAITRYLAIDALRAQRIRSTEAIDAVLLHLEAPGREPAAATVESDERDQVVRALRDLPVDQRRAVVLAALGGRTAAEVGALEGIPLGTAKTRIRTGLRRLRTALADQRDDRETTS